MQKLRDLYAETQNNAKNNFDKVTLDRCKRMLAYANREYQNINAQNDHNLFLEITFYKGKFELIIEKYNLAINEKTKKAKLQADIINVLSDNFKLPGEKPYTPQAPVSPPPPQAPPPKKVEEPSSKPKLISSPQKQQKLLKKSPQPKDMINSYFDMKKTQIQQSKIGFKSVLQNVPKASQKYAIKSNIKVKQAKQANDENIVKLTKQIEQLSKDLEKSKVSSEFNHGLIQIQKHKYERRIKELIQELEKLNQQNERLKHQSEFLNSRPPSQSQPAEQQLIQRVFFEDKIHQISVQDPHVIKYRSNDMSSLNKKFQRLPPQQNTYLKAEEPMNFGIKIPLTLPHKGSEQEILLKAFPQHFISSPIKSEYEFQKSNIKFNKSQVQNEDKNIILRSKLSFFKPAMVLYRGQQFELAIKSNEIVPLQSCKVIIYINNKDKFQRRVSISYINDPNYYEIKTVKKLNEVEGLKQGKEQIEVKLKSQGDFDILIEAKLEINKKTLKFIIPTMMLQFLPGKHENPKRPNYQKFIINYPMHQFSNIFSTMQMIPLQKNFQERVQVGSVYARSKYFEGYIYLRWKSKDQLQIQTIRPWIVFLGYLMMKDC